MMKNTEISISQQKMVKMASNFHSK